MERNTMQVVMNATYKDGVLFEREELYER